MNYSNLFRIAVRALIRNKLRAFLTMLGIIIGVASVIAMLAIGEGSKQKMRKQISSMGTNMVMIMPNMQRRGGVSLGASSSMALKYSDVTALQNEAAHISLVSPEVRASGQVIYSNQNTQTTIYGVSEEYLSIRKLEILSGRIFNANELKSMAKVCILGQTVVENLFGAGADPVGLSIRIKNLPFLIIGVLKDKGESGMGQDQDDLILAPYTTVQRRLAAIDYINGIYASAVSEEKSPVAIAEVQEIFLFLKSDYKIKRINFNDILYIEGLKDYVKVYIKNSIKPVLSLTSLKLLESKLPENKFMRVHRSFIVNLEKIDTIERSRIVFGKEYIPVSDQYKVKFQEFLDKNFL
jgi:putative ABC transport system permease protein